ncbi:MAG TPA: hypothetical protein VF171_08890 [Trueperaceae bacterium]
MDYQWLAQFGFAAVVAFYVLTRLEPAINRNTNALHLLTILVARWTGQDLEEIRRDFIANGKGSPL